MTGEAVKNTTGEAVKKWQDVPILVQMAMIITIAAQFKQERNQNKNAIKTRTCPERERDPNAPQETETKRILT